MKGIKRPSAFSDASMRYSLLAAHASSLCQPNDMTTDLSIPAPSIDLRRSSAVAILAPDPYRSRNHGSERPRCSRSSMSSGAKTWVWQSTINMTDFDGFLNSQPRLPRLATSMHESGAPAGSSATVDYQRFGELSIPNPTAPLPVYIHVPFCSKHCWYCDFNVYERMGRFIDPYCKALIREIKDTAGFLDGRVLARCVYVGGGTPSLIGAKRLARILDTLSGQLGFKRGSEATVEANPSNTTPSLLSALVEAGYDRLSVGAQSLSNKRLAELDRLHSSNEALLAIERAKAAGFRSVSADLLYGAPGQSVPEFADGLKETLDRDVDHISAYALTLHGERAMRIGQSRGGQTSDEAMAGFYGTAAEILGDAGFEHYEVSNWARPGHRCEYNESIWQGSEYLAFGCGAHGYFAGRRFSLTRQPQTYIDAVVDGQSTVEHVDVLGTTDRLTEAIAFPLRTRNGIDLRMLAETFECDLVDEKRGAIDALVTHNLVELSDGRLRLTDSGMILADAIALRLLPDEVSEQSR